jgi:prolyl-tRNA synthetase
VRRDTGEKETVSAEALHDHVETLLDTMQADLFAAAKKRMDDNTHTVDSYDEYRERVGDGGFYRVFLDHTNPEVEKQMQEDTRSTIRCIPFDAPEESGSCMITGAPCSYRVIAAQSY